MQFSHSAERQESISAIFEAEIVALFSQFTFFTLKCRSLSLSLSVGSLVNRAYFYEFRMTNETLRVL